MKLDKEEQDILDSFEKGEWVRVENPEEEIRRHQQYARNTLKKDKRVNIRLSSKVLEELQVAALRQGIPYQTLMASILHRYVHGGLVDKTGAA
ncbi:MAG: antitoxin [Candidatus Electrothrix sp. AW2]|jgi:predicted DNA binding CopG/RHH family protein|nr:antitoxin [Candidatus Electrothrix sp. AX1]MCI5129684.1 antitoxin [Candidatus Electrothrix gigas]MCI5136074.1 antitoxin [Candidatus Electrothrix gigas]MCI5180677.1 antitoxin [Candidatus Electrothrix gigas]MCI5183627.1 antitoxin [Candidatus Electrothrix gigas]